MIICLGHTGAAETVGFYDVRARVEVGFVNRADDLGLGQTQKVVIALSSPG